MHCALEPVRGVCTSAPAQCCAWLTRSPHSAHGPAMRAPRRLRAVIFTRRMIMTDVSVLYPGFPSESYSTAAARGGRTERSTMAVRGVKRLPAAVLGNAMLIALSCQPVAGVQRCGVDWFDANGRCSPSCAAPEDCMAGENCFAAVDPGPCETKSPSPSFRMPGPGRAASPPLGTSYCVLKMASFNCTAW